MNGLLPGRSARVAGAATLALLAAAALVAVLSGSYSSTDSRILYALPVAFLAASGLLSALALVARGAVVLGWAGVACRYSGSSSCPTRSGAPASRGR